MASVGSTICLLSAKMEGWPCIKVGCVNFLPTGYFIPLSRDAKSGDCSLVLLLD